MLNMPRKPTGNPRGPQPVHIDWDKVDRWLECGCLGTEVAAALGCHPDTLYERCLQEKGSVFSAYSREKKCSGDKLLRQKQMEIAMKGDKTMLLWLGKQRLGQRDTPEYSFDKEVKTQLEALNEWTKTFHNKAKEPNGE
jgi:hypothetical protein